MTKKKAHPRFVMCIDNAGYRASLEARKVYRTVKDPASEARGLLRIVDESGDDYLYPAQRFIAIELPRAAVGAFADSAHRA